MSAKNKSEIRKKKALERLLTNLETLNTTLEKAIESHPELQKQFHPADYEHLTSTENNPYPPLPAGAGLWPEPLQNAAKEFLETLVRRAKLWAQIRNTATTIPFSDLPEPCLTAGLCSHGLTSWKSYFEFSRPRARNQVEQQMALAGSALFKTNLDLL